MIQDLVKQLEDLRRRMVNNVTMTDKEGKFDKVTFKSGNANMTVSAETFSRLGKRMLL